MPQRQGEYRDRLIIQKRTEVRDAAGEAVPSWSLFAIRWGKVQRKSGTEARGGSVTVADDMTEFRMHLTRGVGAKMRILTPRAVTTLAAAVTGATSSTLTVADAGEFPLEGRYRVRLADELMEVTAGQGTTTWIVTRGMDGTSAALSTTGQVVQQMAVYDIQEAHVDWPLGVETVVKGREVDANS